MACWTRVQVNTLVSSVLSIHNDHLNLASLPRDRSKFWHCLTWDPQCSCICSVQRLWVQEGVLCEGMWGPRRTKKTLAAPDGWVWGAPAREEIKSTRAQDAEWRTGSFKVWMFVFRGVWKSLAAMSHGSTWVWGGRITGQIASTRALDAEERMFVDLSSGVTD